MNVIDYDSVHVDRGSRDLFERFVFHDVNAPVFDQISKTYEWIKLFELFMVFINVDTTLYILFQALQSNKTMIQDWGERQWAGVKAFAAAVCCWCRWCPRRRKLHGPDSMSESKMFSVRGIFGGAIVGALIGGAVGVFVGVFSSDSVELETDTCYSGLASLKAVAGTASIGIGVGASVGIFIGGPLVHWFYGVWKGSQRDLNEKKKNFEYRERLYYIDNARARRTAMDQKQKKIAALSNESATDVLEEVNKVGDQLARLANSLHDISNVTSLPAPTKFEKGFQAGMKVEVRAPTLTPREKLIVCLAIGPCKYTVHEIIKIAQDLKYHGEGVLNDIDLEKLEKRSDKRWKKAHKAQKRLEKYRFATTVAVAGVPLKRLPAWYFKYFRRSKFTTLDNKLPKEENIIRKLFTFFAENNSKLKAFHGLLAHFISDEEKWNEGRLIKDKNGRHDDSAKNATFSVVYDDPTVVGNIDSTLLAGGARFCCTKQMYEFVNMHRYACKHVFEKELGDNTRTLTYESFVKGCRKLAKVRNFNRREEYDDNHDKIFKIVFDLDHLGPNFE